MLFQKSLLLLAAALPFFGWAAARFGVLPVGVGVRSRFGDAYWRRGPEAASRGLLRARGGERLFGEPAIVARRADDARLEFREKGRRGASLRTTLRQIREMIRSSLSSQ